MREWVLFIRGLAAILLLRYKSGKLRKDIRNNFQKYNK